MKLKAVLSNPCNQHGVLRLFIDTIMDQKMLGEAQLYHEEVTSVCGFPNTTSNQKITTK